MSCKKIARIDNLAKHVKLKPDMIVQGPFTELFECHEARILKKIQTLFFIFGGFCRIRAEADCISAILSQQKVVATVA